MAHALDYVDDDRMVDDRIWIVYSNGKKSKYSEIFASHIENLVRAENGIPLRKWYGIDLDGPKGLLLIPNTRINVYRLYLGKKLLDKTKNK